ncbi:MAG: HD domain-containing protein, partial [Winogradskyella sp.]
MKHLILEVEKYVISCLNDNLDAAFVYHNLAHTQRVVEKTKELAKESSLPDKAQQHLIIAAWFHDTGFIKTIEGHEKESVKIAATFLASQQVSEDDINAISKLILATQMEYKPKTESEGYIKDADCAHLSSKNYIDYATLLRKEWELTLHKKISKTDWIKENISFLTTHTFNTDLAAKKWEKRKGKNLANLLQDQNKIKDHTEKLKQKKAELNFKKEKLDLPDRGIETMFRVALK